MERKVIHTPEAPAAIGPYSQAVQVGNMLFCSGQIAIDPKTGDVVPGGIAEQTRQVLENLGAVLRAAGMDYRDVVQCQVFLADMADFQAMNQVYAEYFRENPPARVTVAAAGLPRNVRVEIACIAVKGQ
ncbi:MAG: RidA family protein [Bacteroidetes bacterium]|nr:RidA family protein [Rhodothermia bacterium]MCS7154308.1 RidA family protein [Bacteroidota bacterium]MCX7906656.1 RidA family protein [Bacteroidota bacterium]MDW8137064.1 RidA family protein [Bacteroidota bacterium]MDW8285065.1 RidA family protein [Bacteroidota bacterium]